MLAAGAEPPAAQDSTPEPTKKAMPLCPVHGTPMKASRKLGSYFCPRRPVGVTDKETYIRETLAVGDVSTTVYIHESLTPEQALNRLVAHYKAWCVNMPGGRR